ncbi:chemotaxis protein CheW [Desulfobacula sp.]|uniref:chemotaxis protein CheW n=1 Tax=Desulfobacula sp. TaxID=2593537 RepID=UPI0026376EA2|nr:chemotaxis protein CheW [Desulfobacula sp.]
MEKYGSLMNLIDGMASDFLFIDGREIDVPTAGKLLNNLDELIKEANSQKVFQLKNVAGGLNSLLEKTILDDIDDKEASFNVLEKGIALMQEIGESFKNTNGYEGDIESFMESIVALTGDQLLEEVVEAYQEESQPAETIEEIQDDSLLRDFIVEGLEYIDEIEVNLLNLEQEPENLDCVNAIFRPFHSIKGVAGFLNLETVCDFAHILENLLDRIRNKELSVTSRLIDIILDGADALKALIIELKENMEGNPGEPLEIDLPALKKRIENVEQDVSDAVEVKRLGEILVEDGAITEENLEQGLEVAQELTPPKKIGESLISEGKVTPKQVSQALRKQTKQVADTAVIRVNIKKLDDLIDMVGELVITQAMIRQNSFILSNSDIRLSRDVSRLSSITSELQRTSTSLRMVPIKQTFQRTSRLIRDLSRDTGKQVGVVTEGEDTEIDRNMVEEIYNPLVHMVRNAVDHGIDSSEERIKAGKPEKGLIQLKAFHRGGNVVIEISDDGKGLDRDVILKKAVEKKLIDSSQDLSDQDIYKLIFLPGFSTAAKVTDISGRGVGMDVVKQAVVKLRGKIEIDSTINKGSTFSLGFPLTMAIIDGMIVRVGTERYIIPTTAIRQLLRPVKKSYNNIIGKGETINVMGNLLQLVRLYKIFDIEPEHKNPWDAIVVVVECENSSKTLMVDEILGEEEVVIKSLGESLKNSKGVSGGAIMGDGNVGLILDPEGLFELSEV